MGFSVVSRPLARPAGLGLVLAGFIAGVAVQLQQSALWPGGAGCCHSVQPVWLEGLDSIEKPGAAQHGPAGSAGGPLAGRWLDRLAGQRFSSVRAEPGAGRTRYCRHGYVAAMPQIGEDAVRFRLGIESARLNGHAVTLPPQLLLGWYSGFAGRETKSSSVESSDKSELALELQRKPQLLRPGERWQMTVRLKAPHGNSNPHGFDYELWLWEQGIQATGYVRTSPHDAPPLKLSSSWRYPVERARQSVREAIYERVDNRQLAGVLAALVVGDQNAIERADWDVFRATGVAHLMSISGLHITMFAWLASLLLAALHALFSGWGSGGCKLIAAVHFSRFFRP